MDLLLYVFHGGWGGGGALYRYVIVWNLICFSFASIWILIRGYCEDVFMPAKMIGFKCTSLS